MSHGHVVRWWYAVTSYECPTCGAAPGSSCVTYTGNERREPHADRSRLASANHWRDPDELSDLTEEDRSIHADHTERNRP